MDYNQWLEYIKENKDDNYWEHIVTFAPEIASDIKEYKHHIVSKRLGLKHSTVFSVLKPLILAIAKEAKVETAND